MDRKKKLGETLGGIEIVSHCFGLNCFSTPPPPPDRESSGTLGGRGKLSKNKK